MKTRISAVFAVLVSSGFALAGEPPEAIAACSGLNEGVACALTLGGKNLTGTCRRPPDGTTIACLPEGFGPGMGHHRGPPQEAVQACANLSANAACSFTMGGRAVTGTCFAPPMGGGLACRPSDLGMRGGPPPESLQACASSTASEACSFTIDGRTVSGTCFAPPHLEGKLACRPNEMPGPGMGMHRGPPPEAVQACASLAADAACSFTLDGRAVTGTCFAPPHLQGTLVCHPAGMGMGPRGGMR